MKLRFASMALVVALLGAFVLAPLNAEAQRQNTGPLTGTFSGVDQNTGNLIEGTLSITSVDVVDNVLTAFGTATVGEATSDFTSAISLPTQGRCTILDLTLGPLNLDLLGLVVDLNQIDLTITAVPGPGNLLGNLLCTVAGLLDRGGALTAITNLINRINELLA